MSLPLVTIISPVYNQERYVAECVESALAQSYPHWEQIFVDDGSTDRTLEILAGYDDPRVRVLALPHRGLASLGQSYNAALAEAHGSLVGILEGDDRWPSGKLAHQVPLFDDPNTLVSWGRAGLIGDNGESVGEMVALRERDSVVRISAREAFHRLSRTNFLVPSVTTMVRRRALDAVGGFRQTGSTLFVDLPTWLWITATQDGHLAFLNRTLGLYRIHDAQTSRRRRAQMTREHLQVVQQVEEALSPTVLAQLGWDARSRGRALTRARLAEGEILLEDGRYREAFNMFVRAWRSASGGEDRLLALVGLASAATHLNLVPTAFAVRTAVRRFPLHRTPGDQLPRERRISV